MHEPTQVAEALVELADTLGDGFDLIDHLTGLCTRLVDVLGADGAGVFFDDESSGLRLVASSDETTRFLELFELRHHEGPCLECHRTGTPLVNEPIEASSRWPTFASEARSRGFGLTHAFPMVRNGEVLGAVNVFAVDPSPVVADTLSAARSMVDAATVGLLQLRARNQVELVNGQLEQALASRVAIEQAKGMLAGRYDIGVDAAFDALRRYARSHETRIADVAARIVDGTLDGAQLLRLARAAGHDRGRGALPCDPGEGPSALSEPVGPCNSCPCTHGRGPRTGTEVEVAPDPGDATDPLLCRRRCARRPADAAHLRSTQLFDRVSPHRGRRCRAIHRWARLPQSVHRWPCRTAPPRST